ncbi:hypothetical protein AB9Q10_09355 [Streptomyces krungchingensis]|uniref:hypothetical protein n=1 Tax=Streptomyces krungchingensis TaxID=1565034 RepID=UPI003CE727E1
MIRFRRTGVAAAGLLAALAGSPGPAQAQAQAQTQQPSAGSVRSAATTATTDSGRRLPDGWRIIGEGAAAHLVWRADAPVPPSDSGVMFYSGDETLGRPHESRDGRTFRLPLRGIGTERLTDLRARSGERRLDAPEEAKGGRDRRPGLAATPPVRPPADPVDPGRPGAYRTVTGEYALHPIRLPGFAAPVEMRAVVVAPTATAPGHRPLALFLHGRHGTCFTGRDDITGDWPCPAGAKPVPSHRGYLRAQKLLASQGYVTVSVSANGVNGQDHVAEDGGAQARSSLVRQHLARWADWAAHRSSAPRIVRSAAPADLSRVLLVGHSRGGEGVNRAATDSLYRAPAAQDGYRGPVRWHIRGTVLIGPTLFGQNPAPDVPSMTILPGCDGDVSDLQGEMYVDGTRGVGRGAALHSAVYMVGANHNYFNSEWTPGQAQAPAEDDFWSGDEPDRVCSRSASTRLTARQQQAAGATYLAAAARVFVAGDDRVRPLLDGSNRRAPSAGPARVLTHAVGGRRIPAFLPDAGVTVDGGRLCNQVDTDVDTACLGPGARGGSPHFVMWETSKEPGRHAVALRWTAPGTTTRVRAARAVDVAGSDALALRVIVPPDSRDTRLDVAVADASGRRAVLGRLELDGLPGTDRTASLWGQEARVPLSAATRAGLDLRRVTVLELVPRSRTGRAWLMDAWGWRAGLPAVRAAEMPRVDVGRLSVAEGDSGTRTYHVPVSVSGHGRGTVRLFVADPATGETSAREVTVRPGGHAIDVRVRIRGNTRFGYDVAHDVFVKAVRGAVVGAHLGGVVAVNDDPAPAVRVTPVADQVTEGRSLRWKVSLSEVADTEVQASFAVLPVAGGTELSTTDVDPRWLRDHSGAEPLPARPLSSVEELYVFVDVPAGHTAAELTLPTVVDRVAEPEETVRLRSTVHDDTGEPHEGPPFTGRVRDAS